MRGLKCLTVAFLLSCCASGAAVADVIVSPVDATASSTFDPSCCSILNTINHSGLLTDFTSGVTDFDSYVSGNPLHSSDFIDPSTGQGTKWFSEEGVTSATVLYNLGAVLPINRFAFWNEDSSGITNFDLLISADGINYTPILTGVTPLQTPEGNDIPVQVFGLGNESAQFVELHVYNCPKPTALQDDPTALVACAMSEVAFAETTGQPAGVPLPGSLSLAITGIAAFTGIRRKLPSTAAACEKL